MEASFSSLAILGGTFNPPHYGHIHPALATIETIGAGKLGLMPCKVPPHKQLSEMDESHRVKMTELACSLDKRMYAELCELTLPAPSYSVRTLQKLRTAYPDVAIFFLMGEDSFHQLTSWYNWQSLTDYCHIVVMRRKGEKTAMQPELKIWLKTKLKQVEKGIFESVSGNVYFVDSPYYTISSTVIRQAVTQYFNTESIDTSAVEKQIIKWLPEPVFNYIKSNRLYSSVIN